AVSCAVRPAPPKFIVLGLTTIDVKPGLAVQLESDTVRPITIKAPSRERKRIEISWQIRRAGHESRSAVVRGDRQDGIRRFALPLHATSRTAVPVLMRG